MASQYVLADQMFASDFDISSFISHQYIIAGVNPNASVNSPDGLWGCTGGPGDQIPVLGPNRQFRHYGNEVPCWDPTTLGDELDAAKLPWAFYATKVRGAGSFACNPAGLDVNAGKGRTGLWSAYQAINHICYGADWSNVITPPSQFFTDIAAGKLGAVTWITPTYGNSDHGGSGSKTGPSWVTALVNAIGESQFWDSTAIFIFWDDSGGWYDPVAPAYADNDGLGFRLPLLIISPYAKQGYVSHVTYEHGSILKFTEDQFGLARLGASDTRANSPESDCFDFTAAPRAFVPIASSLSRSYFMHQPEDLRAPDSE
jgi:phospholipase C